MQNNKRTFTRSNQTVCRKKYAHTCKELCKTTGEYVHVQTEQSVEKSMHTPVNNYAEQQESMYMFQPNHLKKKICPHL